MRESAAWWRGSTVVRGGRGRGRAMGPDEMRRDELGWECDGRAGGWGHVGGGSVVACEGSSSAKVGLGRWGLRRNVILFLGSFSERSRL